MKRAAIIAAALGAIAFSGAGYYWLGASRAATVEPLRDWSAMLPDDPEGYAPAFYYAAPQGPFRSRPAEELRGLILGGLPQPMGALLTNRDRDADIRELTGLDFASVDALAIIGGMPDTFLALAVPGTDANAFASAYEARDFAREDIAGQPVYHLGEDNAVDIPRRDMADPFGRGLGSAQRVALVGGTVLAAHAWPAFRPAVEALAGDGSCTNCLPWRAMLGALEAAAPGSHLEWAAGWPAVSSFRVEDAAGLGVDGEALPAFTLAMFAVTVRADSRAPHLVVHFSDAATAEAGAAEIARRLESGVLPGNERSRQLVAATAIGPAEADNGAVAVLTIATGNGGVEEAYRVVRALENGIMRREFRPLAFE